MRPKDAFGRYGCVPRELHPAWFELTYYARAIAMDLFSRVDDFDQLSVITHGPWMDSLCKQLAIPGKERRNAKRAMQQLVDGGFLRAEEGRVCLVLVPSPAPSLSPGCPVPSSVPLPVVDSKSTQVPENTQVTICSQPAIKASKQSSAPAHAPARDSEHPQDIGFRFVYSLLGRSSFDISPPGAYPRAYSWLGSKPQAERDAVKLAVEADTWCTINPHKVDAPHLERRWQHYLHGDAKPVLKPLAATPREQLEKARERLRAARIEVNRLDGLPWFDREKPSFPARRERAAGEVTAAEAALTELERGGAQAVAS